MLPPRDNIDKPAASPSRPSIQLIAFVIPVIHKIVIIKLNIDGISIIKGEEEL